MRRFSRTVRLGKMPRPSGMAHSPLLTSFSVGLFPTGVSPTSTSPALGRIRPLITLSRVDFPAPLGPSSANTLPGGTTRSTPWSTSIRP